MKSETTLWVAVLARAVKDAEILLKKVQKNPTLWANPLFRSEVLHLKRYFRTRSMEPGGFGFICLLLDIDPDLAFSQIEELFLKHLTSTAQKR